MKRKSRIFPLCLLVLLISNLTAYSQDTSKYCLTPDQRRFVLKQAYELRMCDSVSASLQKELQQYKQIVINDKVLLDVKNAQIGNLEGKADAFLKDNQFLKDQLHLKNKQVRQLKIGIFAIGGVAILTEVLLLSKK